MYVEHFWEKQFPKIIAENSLPKVHSNKVQRLLQNAAFIDRLKRPVNVVYDKEVPYLAGYSKDGKTVYFDKHLKPYLLYHGKTYDVRDFIIVHEVGEKALMDLFHLEYKKAHHIITSLEAQVVAAHGLNWWVYTKFLAPQIKTIYNEKLNDIPKDLDPAPYRDEHETRILQALAKGQDIRKGLRQKQFLKRKIRH